MKRTVALMLALALTLLLLPGHSLAEGGYPYTVSRAPTSYDGKVFMVATEDAAALENWLNGMADPLAALETIAVAPSAGQPESGRTPAIGSQQATIVATIQSDPARPGSFCVTYAPSETNATVSMARRDAATASVSINNIAFTPTRSGNFVYPNIDLEITGQAAVRCQITLYQQVGSRWIEVDSINDTKYVNGRCQFNPGSYVQAGGSYQYTIYVEASGTGSDSATINSRPFVLR